MISMPLGEIAAVVVGELAGPADLRVTGAAFVDSREPVVGGLFVAVPGERVDGHDYAAAAVSSGAAAVLAQRAVAVPAVIVVDAIEAVGRLARHVVSRLDRMTVVGITGSQGKTSVKDVVAQLLERDGETVATRGSFNNEIGAPLTALRAEETTSYLVSELGARGVGHIEYLANMVRPRIGVVLNVGVAHVGEFGSQAAIAVAKGELVEALPADGVAILNADDPLVAAMAERTDARVVMFGSSTTADVRYDDARMGDDGLLDLTLEGAGRRDRLTVPLVGVHHASNVAAAVAVAIECGLEWDDVIDTLGRLEPRSHWRMELTTTPSGVIVVNDAYNANPDSMRAAMEALAELGRRGAGGRTVAVLGEMRELGESSDAEHDAIGRLAVELGVDRVIVVGEGARSVHLGASGETSWSGESVWVPDVATAIERVLRVVAPGDVVLVKASRAAGLERVGQALAEGSHA